MANKSSQVGLGSHQTLVVICFLLCLCVLPTKQQTNSQPVNVGLIAALPWDVSNTLRAPIGGPLSLALSVTVAIALSLGLVLAPVNYLLGYPSRIYHPSRGPGLLTTLIYKGGWQKVAESMMNSSELYRDELFGDFGESRGFSSEESTSLAVQTEGPLETNSFPDFLTSAFFLIPEEDVGCRKLMLCHAHGFLTIFPTRVTKVIRFFSKRMMSIPDEYQSAVVLGLNDQSACQKTFKCHKNISSILKDVLFSLLSSDLKELWKLQKLF